MVHYKNSIILATVIFTLVAFIPFAQAVPVNVTVTYTVDNEGLGSWLTNEGVPVSLPLGENANAWNIADTLVLNLAPGHTYQLIWQVVNYGDISDPWGNVYNPGGFLAEIASNPLISGDLLSSKCVGCGSGEG